MNENGELSKWLDEHNMSYSMRHDVVYIHGFGRCLIQNEYEHIFKKERNGSVVFNCIENYAFLRGDDIYYVIFKFGDRWFYVDIREEPEEMQFHLLKYLGEKPKFQHGRDFYYLGVHTGYELLNGSGLMKDWCKKAAFLGYKGIGIADRNTFAASLDLQKSATEAKLGYVFGYSLSVVCGEESFDVIIYAKDMIGFRNILRIQKIIGVDEMPVDTITLMNRAGGNCLVFGKRSAEWMVSNDEGVSDIVKAFNGRVYFQVDLAEYKADRIDMIGLNSCKCYFDNYYENGKYKHGIKPVLIQDSYYIDKEEWITKSILNKIDTGAAHEKSSMQYMKTIDELYHDFRSLFSEKYTDDVFDVMCDSTLEIASDASAMYDLSDNYMPEYIMTDEERQKYGTNHNMFLQLLEDGFKKLVPDGEEKKYRERLNEEVYVLEQTDNVDYILVQWDVVNWAHRNNILTGIGRGSASGSLVLYLLGITIVDPMKYDLIFERFLVPERAGLQAEKVTIIGGETIGDCIELSLENGKVVNVYEESEMIVIRNGVEMLIKAKNIRPDDDIKFDNRDLLFTVNEISENNGWTLDLFE